MDFVAETEQIFGKIGAVLSGHAGNQRYRPFLCHSSTFKKVLDDPVQHARGEPSVGKQGPKLAGRVTAEIRLSYSL